MKRLLLFLPLVTIALFSQAQTYSFTNAGVSGLDGPTQVDINTAYFGTNLDGNVTITTQGIQEWVVPASGIYEIVAIGAVGGSSNWSTFRPGGNGYSLSGQFTLTSGDTILIAVGQSGETNAIGGGGGGSFVAIGSSPLIVAGGGGGASSDQNGISAVFNNDGTMDSQNIIAGGTAGNGGAACTSNQNNGGGGGGFYGNGMDAQPTSGVNWGRGGFSFLNGCQGGVPGRMDGACTADPYGGFGGGGSGTCNTVGGGGGGGYSGGAGGPHISNCGAGQRSGGGGGGSFNSGSSVVDNGAVGTGNGSVTITLVCQPAFITPDQTTLNTVTDQCSSTPATPTATADCGITVNGVPDVSFPITTFGTTTVTWTYEIAGISTTQTQDITIVDTNVPLADANSLPDVMGICQIDSIVPPTATDSCVGLVIGTPDVSFPITTQGTTVVTWTYDDGAGNTSTQTQIVILNDTIAPVADSVSLPDLDVCLEANPAAPTGTDDCAGIIVATPDQSMPITTPGLTVVTWTFTDNNGNTSTLTQNVTVNGVDVSVTNTGGTLTVGQSGATYQWLDCENNNSPISGETNQSFTATAISGTYAVAVEFNGCTDTSACNVVDYSAIDELSNTVKIYPNPSNGKFNYSTSENVVSIEVIDMLGRSVPATIDTNLGTIDASGLEAGEYHIKIQTESGIITKDVVILK